MKSLYQFEYQSPVGILRIIHDGTHVVKLLTPLQVSELETVAVSRNDPVIATVCAWLDAYFTGNCPSVDHLPLRLEGTPFQLFVWQRLSRIPCGQTVTYGQIAKEYAQIKGLPKMSAQAVGQAVGANPISIIIPCHRVIGSNGQLTGYAGGIACKHWLLTHEGVVL